MVYTYTPTYYSTLHDSITSLCKNILPFSFKKRRLPSAEHKLSEMQSENLKWQQDSFHQMLNLMGLHKEGILGENEVSTFRTHLLETLIAAPVHQEHPTILRDKLLFLQELLYAKCITIDEYHSSKRPLLQRLAVQGAEIEARDVIVGPGKDMKQETSNNPSDEEWSVIDLKDENCLINKENSSHSKNKSKVKQHIKGAASAFGFGTLSHKAAKGKHEKSIFDTLPQNTNLANEFGQFPENPFWDSHLRKQESETKSILMSASSPTPPPQPLQESANPKRKPFRALFTGNDSEEKAKKSGKKHWGGLKWKRNDSDDETAPLSLNERSCNEGYSCLGEGPDTKLIKRKLHSDGSPSDFFIDKVLGEKIKKELSRIQTELCSTNPSLKFSNEQIEAISTKLPVDKADLKNFFPKTWCDQYGDLVLDVVKKEFKDHVGEMEKLRNAARERQNSSTYWTTFDDDDDDENSHPNLFRNRQQQTFVREENPFFQRQ
ncbi:uncharacterized protein LOC116197690 isoform X1 [Punica granatum]|uniref:Uncharacterized protein LOC116197690 isoform X1 n=1 Tax=Punica granatum TaxID=22663 RepID=A0A6P8CR45_PUNGR|nr:uncharacterized protein LOC116197690 isoform X1 [Punica granatum]